MITALQDVSNVSLVNVAPVMDRVALTGEVGPLSATPSALVVLGATLQPPLTYNASGRLESQVAQSSSAFEAAQMSRTFATSALVQSTLFASSTSFAQTDFAVTPTPSNLIANLASQTSFTGPSDLAVAPLPFNQGAPFTNPAITLEPPVTANIVAALGGTFNPVIPGTTDLSSLVTPVPGLPASLSDGIPDAAPTLAGAPNTASFALPAPTASPLPAATEAERAIPLVAGDGTSAPTAPTTPTVAAAATTEGPATAPPLAPADSADTRIVTPEPGVTPDRATPATLRAEAVLTALNASSANTVTAAPNVVGAPTAASTDALAPAVPVAADAIPAAATTTAATSTAATTAAATPGASSVPGAAIAGVPNASAVPAQAPTPALGATILTPEDILRSPFYPAMAASLYLSAMSFRLQQSSAAELNSAADSVLMVGDVRAVSGVQPDRQGPADDFRTMTRTFA